MALASLEEDGMMSQKHSPSSGDLASMRADLSQAPTVERRPNNVYGLPPYAKAVSKKV